MIELRDYQLSLARQLQRAFAEHRSVCLQLPTGGGKTGVAGYVAQQVQKKFGSGHGGLVLFLVHRRELLRQTSQTMKLFGLGEMCGYISSGYPETPWAPIQIASIATLSRRVKKSKMNPKLIILDEAHHAPAKSWLKVIDAFPDSRILGLTATPARMDGKGLKRASFQKIVSGPSPWRLAKDGWLCQVDTISLPVGLDMSGVKKQGGDFAIGETDERITGAVIANGVKNWMKFAHNLRTIHFAVTRRHSREFVAKLVEQGISAEHVDGSMQNNLRDGIFRRFSDGATKVISNVDIVSEGYDCPECECVVMGRPTGSYTVYKQQAGRVMRPKQDNGRGLILDLAGNFDTHGSAMEDVEWSLEDGVIKNSVKKARSNSRLCDCGYTYPRADEFCPMCEKPANQRVVQEVDVDLVLRTESKKRKEKSQIFREVFWTLGDESKLRELQLENGYNPGVIKFWKKVYQSKWDAYERKHKEEVNRYDG